MKKFKPIIYQSVIFLVFIMAILLIVVYMPSSTYANDTSLGRFGETVRPIGNPNIIMQSENIIVRVSEGVSKVECEFVFINDSDKETTVLMGFPSGEPENENKDKIEWFYDYRLYDFAAWVDGEEIEVRLEKGTKTGGEDGKNKKDGESGMDANDLDNMNDLGLNFPYWYTWEVSFKPGEKKIVKNTYETKNTTSSIGMAQAGYVLTTGAPWKDRIGSGKIVFIMEGIKSYQVESISPANYTYEENTITWQFEDFEPDTNINVVFNLKEEYLLKEQFRYDEKLKPVIELEEQGKYEELVEFINEILHKREYNTDYMYTETGLKLAKAKTLLKIGHERGDENAVREAMELLDDIMDNGGIGCTEAAYILLGCYKERGIDKYRELYDKKVFLRTNGVFQRLAADMFPDLESGHSPEVTNLKVTAQKVCVDIEDKDDDLKKFSVKVWYVEDGKKLHLLDYQVSDPMHFAYSHYTVKYYGFLPAETGSKQLYYRVYAEDWAGNVIDTGDMKLKKANEANARYDGHGEHYEHTGMVVHWASKYAEMFSDMEEVPENISDGDKYISNRDLFNMLIKYSNLSPAEKYDQRGVYSKFLSEDRFVTRAETVSFIISFLQEVRDFKIYEQLLSASDEGKYGYKFKDWDSMPPEYKDSMLSALKVGAVIGYLDGTLRPSDFITTNEALAVLARIKYGEISRTEDESRSRRSTYIDIVLKDEEASQWYYEHSGDKFVICEDGQWYILEDDKAHVSGSNDDKVYKQKCSEELAVKVMNSLPEIYHEEKDGKVEINILQKLGSPPHRYVLIVDANTLEIIGREIREY